MKTRQFFFYESGAKIIKSSKIVKILNGLEEIHLGKYAFTTPESVKELANSIKNIKTLEKINLGENYIEDHGANLLAESLTETSISSINFGWNKLSNQGLNAFYTLINKKSLKELKFGINNVIEHSHTNLIKELSKNDSMEKINLGPSSVKIDEVSKILNAASSLKEFSANIDSQFTNSEMSNFAESIANHKCLTTLKLPFLRATSREIKFLEIACKSNPNLTNLSFPCSMIDEYFQNKIKMFSHSINNNETNKQN